ncbi:hypothetical protein [Pseudonocardia aurantiaca]|uniref:Uncharacterized protein n=1 Tax=Pseudonocardia aurantiaca TaxID=75290 RepID=A0ABW4FPW0_9PSEU
MTEDDEGDAEPMSRSEPEREHREFVAVTRSLTTTVENGSFGDRVLAEHMLRVLGAASQILDQHPVDDRGRCVACRHQRNSVWPRRRVPCVVHDTFAYYLKGRCRFLNLRPSGR